MLSRSDGGRLAVSSCLFAQLETNFVSSSISAGIAGTTVSSKSSKHNVDTPSVELLSDHDVVRTDSSRVNTQHVTRFC